MKKSFLVSMIITVITGIIAVWFIATTEGQIPIHWNINGEIDGYGSPLTMIIFPIIALFTTLLMYALPKIDPKGENIKASGPLLPIIMVLIAALMLGIQIFIIAAVNGADIFNMATFIFAIIGILFIVMGYYLPRVKHNYMVGIRTPWTLFSEDVWVKTHQVSKYWFMAIGLSFLIGIFLPTPCNFIMPFVVAGVVVVGIVVYSYVLFAREKKNK